MTKHTKGPWEYEYDNYGYGYFAEWWEISAGKGKDKVNIGEINSSCADARLIASAPDLLEACKEMLEAYLELDYTTSIDKNIAAINTIEKAIEKAKCK